MVFVYIYNLQARLAAMDLAMMYSLLAPIDPRDKFWNLPDLDKLVTEDE